MAANALQNSFFFLLISCYGASQELLQFQMESGQSEEFRVNSQREFVVNIEFPDDLVTAFPPRLDMECLACNMSHPVLISVRQPGEVVSWTLPFLTTDYSGVPTLHRSSSRTLIYPQKTHYNYGEDYKLSVSISTRSSKWLDVKLKVDVVKDFVLSLDEERNFTLTPSTPSIFRINFSENDTQSAVQLRVESDDDNCLTVSVQDIHSSISDLERNLHLKGAWQSMTRKSAIIIHKSKYPDGAHVFFVLHNYDELCAMQNKVIDPESQDMTSNVVISIVDAPSTEYVWVSAVVTFIIFLVICLVVASVTLVYMSKIKYNVGGKAEPEEGSSFSDRKAAGDFVDSKRNTTVPAAEPVKRPESISDIFFGEASQETPHREGDAGDAVENVGNKSEARYVFLKLLARKDGKVLARKAQRHFWSTSTHALFYLLPVLQLVITYQQTVHKTGNQNLCYYNFLCAHPLGQLLDFNHVFSNVGYVVLGVLFIGLTRRRHVIHKAAARLNPDLDKIYGIPRHFGLFYTMGLSMVIEGIMSACYHVCPNRQNFQFDTSYMYVMSAICMVTLYHARHPDHAAATTTVFAVLAVAILFGISGILDGPSPTFWAIFSVIHVATCFCFSRKIYYFGALRPVKLTLREKLNEVFCINWTRLCPIKPKLPGRFTIIVIANVINWLLALLGPLVLFTNDFCTHLLVIFLLNMFCYCSYYITMKCLAANEKNTLGQVTQRETEEMTADKKSVGSAEKINWLAWTLMALSAITWAVAIVFFLSAAATWKETPAKSREENRPCVFNIYDNHDIWHFLSALAMLFSFLLLLVLDDDLINTPRDSIYVF